MELLNEVRTEQVWQALQHTYQKQNKLADELLDHFCCFIEAKMSQGEQFEESLSQAFQSIAPNGLNELEEELEFIIHLKPQKKMKLTFYVSTMLSAFFISLGVFARYLHWSDPAALLSMAGFLCMLLVMLPSVVIMAIRNWKLLDKLDVFRMIVGVLCGALISIGIIFKQMHFPFASLLILSGLFFLCFVFFPVFFYQLYNRTTL